MNASMVAGRSRDEANLRPVPWRGMAWVTWRQHRAALTGAGALLGVLAVYVWIAGRTMHHAYTAAYAAAIACQPAGHTLGVPIGCDQLINNFNGMNKVLANGYVLLAVPALVGAFVGAPVLARELETGTFRYAWTQGFGRWRWALAKLVALGVVVAAGAGALSLVFSWYYRPYFVASNQLLSLSASSPLSPGLFGLRGVAFAAWTLAAFAIAGFAGMLIRRVVPAIVATLVVYAGLAVAAGLVLRPHYLAPLVTSKLNWPTSAWITNQHWLNKGGQTVSQSLLGRVLLKGAPQLAGKGGVPHALSSWQFLARQGYTQWTSYQPASRFWTFQGIEAGWLVVLSALLIAATVWLVRRRAT